MVAPGGTTLDTDVTHHKAIRAWPMATSRLCSETPDPEAVGHFRRFIGLAGRALTLAEHVAGLLRHGGGSLRALGLLFYRAYRLLEAAAHALFDAVADKQRRNAAGDRSRQRKQNVADNHQRRADDGRDPPAFGRPMPDRVEMAPRFLESGPRPRALEELELALLGHEIPAQRDVRHTEVRRAKLAPLCRIEGNRRLDGGMLDTCSVAPELIAGYRRRLRRRRVVPDAQAVAEAR